MNDKEEQFKDTLRVISKIINNLKYECESRTYILDEDAMGGIFHCRDLADDVLREEEKDE